MDYYSAGDEEMGPDYEKKKDYASYAHTLVRRSATLPSLPKSGILGQFISGIGQRYNHNSISILYEQDKLQNG